MSVEIFVLDTNVLIEAFRRYYAFDIAPCFWRQLASHARKGSIKLTKQVKEEIEKKEDGLKDWLSKDFHHSIVSLKDNRITGQYEEIMAWVWDNNQFLDDAKYKFAKGADGWIIAYAKINGYTIVTQEAFAPKVRSKVPIPNICKEFGVPYIDTFKMIRKLGIKFT